MVWWVTLHWEVFCRKRGLILKCHWGCWAVKQCCSSWVGETASVFCFYPILDIISGRSGLNFLLPLVKNSQMKALLSLPCLQVYLMALMCFYRGNMILCLAEKPLQCDLSPQTDLHSVSIFIFYLDESQFNKMLFSAQFSCHWLSCMNGCFFTGVKVFYKVLWDSPSRPRVVGVMPVGFSWCSVLGTALELRVFCMGGDQEFAGCCPECLGQCLSLFPRCI